MSLTAMETVAMSRREKLVLETELPAIRTDLEKVVTGINAEHERLRQLIDEYRNKRLELFKYELEERGLAWCTHCRKFVPQSETQLMLFEGKCERRHGYEGMFYAIEPFSKLHRVCRKCAEDATNRHGTVGTYDTQARDQVVFHSYSVERREDGYYAHMRGEWARLDEERQKLQELSEFEIGRLADEWGLPPEVKLDSHLHMVRLREDERQKAVR